MRTASRVIRRTARMSAPVRRLVLDPLAPLVRVVEVRHPRHREPGAEPPARLEPRETPPASGHEDEQARTAGTPVATRTASEDGGQREPGDGRTAPAPPDLHGADVADARAGSSPGRPPGERRMAWRARHGVAWLRTGSEEAAGAAIDVRPWVRLRGSATAANGCAARLRYPWTPPAPNRPTGASPPGDPRCASGASPRRWRCSSRSPRRAPSSPTPSSRPRIPPTARPHDAAHDITLTFTRALDAGKSSFRLIGPSGDTVGDRRGRRTATTT